MLTKDKVVENLLNCPSDECSGYYHIAYGYLERSSAVSVDYGDVLLIGNYTFVGKGMTLEEVDLLRTKPNEEKVFCKIAE